MKLYWSSRSPFVRKVMIAAHEIGLADRLERVRTVVSAFAPNAELLPFNPLGKLPTLVLDDGTPLYDSRVICEHLDTLHDAPRLFPPSGPARLAALSWQALGDGMMDFLLLRFTERFRPEGQQFDRLIAGTRLKLDASLAALDTLAPRLAATPFGIGHIAIGCALSYLDFRFAEDGWRARHGAIADWHAGFDRRPSVMANQPVDAY